MGRVRERIIKTLDYKKEKMYNLEYRTNVRNRMQKEGIG